MTAQIKEITEMLEILPEKEQNLAFELIKRLVLAWDADYTKTTPAEAREIEEAKNSEYLDEEEIDWNNLEKYA